eukprot:3797599-Amphidinium_carterae.2
MPVQIHPVCSLSLLIKLFHRDTTQSVACEHPAKIKSESSTTKRPACDTHRSPTQWVHAYSYPPLVLLQPRLSPDLWCSGCAARTCCEHPKGAFKGGD